MARGVWMRRFARWHIWLGWLVGVPLLLWTMSGVLMIARPIEEVRGTTLRIETESRPLLTGTQTVELRTFMQRGRAVTLATGADERVVRYDADTGIAMPPVDAIEARKIVAAGISGGTAVAELKAFDAEEAPFDFRRAMPVWQVTLVDGTRVYVGRDTGEIEAVRTRWWRFYDFMWGLHIMDLQTREDAHNLFTIVFGSLAFVGTLLGFILLFRRRRARVAA